MLVCQHLGGRGPDSWAAARSMQMVFPDKRFYFKPLLLIQLTVTIVGGIIAAVSAMAVRATGFLLLCWWPKDGLLLHYPANGWA